MKLFLSVGLLVIASLLSLSIYAAPQSNSITRHALTVAGANDEWTTTTLKVVPGDILLIKASGEVSVGSYLGNSTPDGIQNGIGQLQLKIGASSVQRAGSMSYIIVKETGVVKLRVNDTKYSDNSGEYAVEVIHIPALLIPEAQPVITE